MIVTWLAMAAVVLTTAVAVVYNRLVRDRNRVDAAWSDIDVQLQRRHDLIPQLVEAVAQYADYERATIEAVTLLRSAAMKASDISERGKVEEELGSGVTRLLAVAENYPDLKANENFLKLQAELVETEDYLQFARRYYNGSVREFNTRAQTIPNNVIAKGFGFAERVYFQKSSDEVAAVPLVELGSIE